MKLGIIGCGHMGGALLDGLLAKKILPASRIYVSDARPDLLRTLKKKYAVHTCGNQALAESCSVIILAVKPVQIPDVVAEIRDLLTPKKVLLSIAAGVTTRRIENILAPRKIPVIRLMPNLAAKVRKGVIVFSPGRYAKQHNRLAFSLFSAVGKTLLIPERLMDAATAISGSGPGYIFHFAEIIHDICLKKGFSKEAARLLAGHVFEGAGAMLAASEESPRRLKEMVSSPGGTTLQGLSVFALRRLDRIFEEAINAALNNRER